MPRYSPSRDCRAAARRARCCLTSHEEGLEGELIGDSRSEALDRLCPDILVGEDGRETKLRLVLRPRRRAKGEQRCGCAAQHFAAIDLRVHLPSLPARAFFEEWTDSSFMSTPGLPVGVEMIGHLPGVRAQAVINSKAFTLEYGHALSPQRVASSGSGSAKEFRFCGKVNQLGDPNRPQPAALDRRARIFRHSDRSGIHQPSARGARLRGLPTTAPVGRDRIHGRHQTCCLCCISVKIARRRTPRSCSALATAIPPPAPRRTTSSRPGRLSPRRKLSANPQQSVLCPTVP